MKIKIIISLVILLGLLLFMPVNLSTQTNASMFCSYGRVFVQFEERHNIWGVMWLDQDGRPVPCDEDGPIKEKPTVNKIKETI